MITFYKSKNIIILMNNEVCVIKKTISLWKVSVIYINHVTLSLMGLFHKNALDIEEHKYLT